jgi:hypothetical protein
MREFDALGVQHEALRSRAAVARISHDRCAHGGKVDADLMLPSGLRIRFDEERFLTALKNPNPRHRG